VLPVVASSVPPLLLWPPPFSAPFSPPVLGPPWPESPPIQPPIAAAHADWSVQLSQPTSDVASLSPLFDSDVPSVRTELSCRTEPSARVPPWPWPPF